MNGHHAIAGWIATITGLAGSLCFAANLGLELIGLCLFTMSGVLIAAISWATGNRSMLVLQAGYILINLAGIMRR